MTIDIFLLQIVAFSCAVFLFQSHVPRGWKLLSGLILLALALLVGLQVPQAGWIIFAVWIVLILLPLFGYAKVSRQVRQENYNKASQLAKVLRWLHPLDGMLTYPELLRGLALGQQGKRDEAEAIFQRYATPTTANGRLAIALLYRVSARWGELLAWLNQQPSQTSILQDQDLAIYYLRSLGETGQLNELLEEVERFTRKHNRTGNSDLAWLYAMAFCGQPDQVRKLFAGSLKSYSENTRQFWIATAELAAGNESGARQQLLELRDRSHRTQQQAIDWRLAQPSINVEQTLTENARRILVGFRVAIAQDENYSNRAIFSQRKAFATYALMAANILVFGMIFIPLFGASVPPQVFVAIVTIFEKGILVPEQVAAGEWWRVISANFLHAGFLHLFANMVGLYFYGTLIESQLGSRKFLIAYLFSGIGAMVSVTIVTLHFGDPTQGTVGASGAIMGLLGVFIAILLKGWKKERAAIAGRQLRFALLLVALQTVSDVLTPRVSLLGHISGLVLGFLAGCALKKKQETELRGFK